MSTVDPKGRHGTSEGGKDRTTTPSSEREERVSHLGNRPDRRGGCRGTDGWRSLGEEEKKKGTGPVLDRQEKTLKSRNLDNKTLQKGKRIIPRVLIGGSRSSQQ